MFFKLYFIALPVFFILDMLWLGLVAKGFYREQIGFLMRPDVNWVAAIIFYLVFLVGVVVFVIQPAVEANSWQKALYLGILFGVVTYAAYDLTNLAVTKDWPILITIVDLIWGGVLSASVSLITFGIYKSWVA